MSESPGRRIKRSINIDMNSVSFCTPEMLAKFRKISLLTDYIDEKEKELNAYNEAHRIDDSIRVNGRRQTNIGVFRAYLVNYLKSLHQIHAAQPIELLHGEQEGEREPKTKLLTAWIGLICLGLGYYLALTCQNPMEALGKFFGAVLLVMAGTYCLFSAGSIALLKLLKSNKRY